MTQAAFEVTAGVIPGKPEPQYTKVFPYQAEHLDQDKLVPQDQPTYFSKLSEEAHLYARSLENPAHLNWVQCVFIWF